ncbi:unnamed protein product [Adineta steineri]|uniref:Uncharacterized protein n=1 Tax=Adineta steineri TaxID=433720 RepID=A0A813NL83_9BILA|nr:unnamed protein product [Adineta steineri]CAF0753203.1 unnamed protein product [Adineta steineri]
MQLILLNVILIVFLPLCYSEFNRSDSTTTVCGKCSSCWTLFSKNYGSCSTEVYDLNFDLNPFNKIQPVCIDTLVLLIIIFLSIVTIIPTCLWLIYLCIRRCRNIDAKYVVNERIMM